MAEGTRRRANDDAGPYWNGARQRWEPFIELPRLDGRRRRKKISASSRSEVRSQAKEARRAIALGRASSSHLTVAAHLDTWVSEVLPGGRVSASTVEIYARTARLHVVPHIGGIRLVELDTRHVERMMGALAAQGLSPATIRLARRVLARALRSAQRDRLVDRNVAALTDGPRLPRRESPTFTPDDAHRLLDGTRGSPEAASVWTLLTTGLRRAELLGLCWSDLDLDGATLTVRRQLQRRREVGLVLQEDLKSGTGHRRVKLLGPVVELLHEHRADQLRARLALGPEWSMFAAEHGGLVFATARGGPLDGGNWAKRFGRLCEEAGLDVRNPHAARHGVASTPLAMGIPAPVIADLLGHASPQVTEQVYVHLFGPAREEAAAAIGQALFGKKSG